MGQYLAKRLLLSLLTLWVLSMISWLVIELPPGNYVDVYIEELIQGGSKFAGDMLNDPELRGALEEQFGLNKPSYVRYAKWIWRMLHGDLGNSTEYEKPVTEVIGERLLMTIILATTTAILAWGLAVLAGGILAMIFSGWANVQVFTEFMNLIYVGWGLSFGQTLIMAVWAFSQGFVAGLLIAIFYNIFSTKFN